MNKKRFFTKLLLLIFFSLTSCEKEEKKIETLDGYSFEDILSIDDETLKSFAKYGNRMPNNFYGLNDIPIYQIVDSSFSTEDIKEKFKIKFDNAKIGTNREYTIISFESIFENDLYRIINIKYEEQIGKKTNYYNWNAISFNENKCLLKSRYMNKLNEVKIFDFNYVQTYLDIYEYMSHKNCKFITSRLVPQEKEYIYESLSANISYLDDSSKCSAVLKKDTWVAECGSGVTLLKSTEYIKTTEYNRVEETYENYSYSCILIGIKHEYSMGDRVFVVNDFPEIEIEQLEDLTITISEDNKKETFHKILKATLVTKTKENVLYSIDALKNNKYVEFVEPDYIYNIDI